jgi:hypothetical protein
MWEFLLQWFAWGEIVAALGRPEDQVVCNHIWLPHVIGFLMVCEASLDGSNDVLRITDKCEERTLT